MVQNATDLEAYIESLRLLRKLYDLVGEIPQSEKEIISECKKYGKSIPPNIAEAFTKRQHIIEFKPFLLATLEASDELITKIRIIALIVPGLDLEARKLAEEYRTLYKKVNKLLTNWKTGHF